MTRIVRATRERSRWWLGLPLLAVLLVTLVLVQGAFSQPSAHRKADPVSARAPHPAASTRRRPSACGGDRVAEA